LLLAVPAEHLLLPIKAMIDLTGPTQTHVSLLHPQPGNIYVAVSALPSNRVGPNVINGLIQKLKTAGLLVYGYDHQGLGTHRVLLLYLGNGRAKIGMHTGTQIGTDNITCSLADIANIVQGSVIFWRDKAKDAVLAQATQIALPQALKMLNELSPLYTELFPPEQFIDDLHAIYSVQKEKNTLVRVRKAKNSSNNEQLLEIHIFSLEHLPLSTIVGRLQAFALIAMQEAVVDFSIPKGVNGADNNTSVRLSSVHCQITSHDDIPMYALDVLQTGIQQVFNRTANDDALNALILLAGLTIEQLSVLACLRNYLILVLPEASISAMNHMLLQHPKASAALYHVFEAGHRPVMSIAALSQTKQNFEQALASVHILIEDRWFRALAKVVQAIVRTNAYVRQSDDAMIIKIATQQVDFVPLPRPWREIFVYAVDFEGIHLRAGAVARGGIRYSDRPSDYRTEVLELMATQVVKNGQIVPTGAKGGFVIRRNSNTADGRISEPFVRYCYRSFIKSLLSISDNWLNGTAIAPAGMRIGVDDSNDPYFVVAADKGTARYSDIANAESEANNFWLGDAFASGGQYGYDHKVIGITARGAWVCVREHMAILGLNADTDTITVVGIGDMGGDVFGNGMLLNPNLHLLAAFNHCHIFLDPNPNTGAAFTERQRLFNAVKGWGNYNQDLISAGGGVFDRSSKSIQLSAITAEPLGVEAGLYSGEELIRVILRAPVDLLYNGGIGTYVKAECESHNQAMDTANNNVRVNAESLRCRVIGEGGNLGFTQQGRLACARQGILLNTDAIDNAAGVNMSDHEVNIKILLAQTPANSLNLKQRNQLLKRLSSAVTKMCLDDNLEQTHALNLAAREAKHFPSRMQHLRDTLLAEGR
ncbi:MAG: NAD-glutamate dehydrogenase, partial [Mariprofundales bacterium]